METPKKKSKKNLIITIVCIVLACGIISSIFEDEDGRSGSSSLSGGGNNEACEAAELHVQSDFYQSIGSIPATASKVVYQAEDAYGTKEVCVAVKYGFTEEDLNNSYWVRFVLVSVYSSGNCNAYRMTTDVPGLDYDNIPAQKIEELKVLWELQ